VLWLLEVDHLYNCGAKRVCPHLLTITICDFNGSKLPDCPVRSPSGKVCKVDQTAPCVLRYASPFLGAAKIDLPRASRRQFPLSGGAACSRALSRIASFSKSKLPGSGWVPRMGCQHCDGIGFQVMASRPHVSRSLHDTPQIRCQSGLM
jgi:hypothetical protein